MTLIELMLVVGLMGVAFGILFTVNLYQNESFFRQLEKAEANQNARASIALIQRYLRTAGWGFEPSRSMLGTVPVGACFKGTLGGGTDKEQQLNCDNVDVDNDGLPGNDRLRLSYMLPRDGGFSENPDFTPPAGSIPAADSDVADPGQHPFGLLEVAAISGPCVTGTPAVATDLLRIDGTLAAPAGARYSYSYTPLEATLGCSPNGYAPGYHFAKAAMVDFYIDRSSPDTPTLMMRFLRSNANDGFATADPVAFDMDDLQVRYYLDTSNGGELADADDADGYADVICDNITDGSATEMDLNGNPTGNNCGSAFTPRERLARLVAVEVAVVARTRTHRQKYDTGGTNITVQNHTFTGRSDGYRRWMYKTIVNLRNNEIR